MTRAPDRLFIAGALTSILSVLAIFISPVFAGAIRKGSFIAVLLDVVYERIVPYALIRGPVTRMTLRRTNREAPREASPG